jgi:hypothetical protein
VAILDRARDHRTFRRIRTARLDELISESRALTDPKTPDPKGGADPKAPAESSGPESSSPSSSDSGG